MLIWRIYKQRYYFAYFDSRFTTLLSDSYFVDIAVFAYIAIYGGILM